MAKNVPNAELVHGSVVNIDQISQLAGRKFDLVYFRWVLAYTDREKFPETLGKLYDFVDPHGILICEECNVYNVYCADAITGARISYPPLDQWLKLSADVDRRFNANFGLGETLRELLINTTHDEQKVEIKNYQPLLADQYTKSILFFGMRSARSTILEAGIRQPQEFDALVSELEELASNSNIGIYYVENTIGLVRK